jgi:hypothetical protein
MSKHTFAIDPCSDDETIAIYVPETNQHVCIMQIDENLPDELAMEFATRIVRACNAHDELVAALEEARDVVACLSDRLNYNTDDALKQIDAALSKARAQP